jgi:hypothetical protein
MRALPTPPRRDASPDQQAQLQGQRQRPGYRAAKIALTEIGGAVSVGAGGAKRRVEQKPGRHQALSLGGLALYKTPPLFGLIQIESIRLFPVGVFQLSPHCVPEPRANCTVVEAISVLHTRPHIQLRFACVPASAWTLSEGAVCSILHSLLRTI